MLYCDKVMSDYLFENYNSGIDAQRWIGLLQDKTIFTSDCLCIMRRFLDIGGEATCTELSKKYGRHFNFYNINCSKLATRIIEKTGCPIPSNNENEKRWPVLFTGRYVDKNTDNVEGEFIMEASS